MSRALAQSSQHHKKSQLLSVRCRCETALVGCPPTDRTGHQGTPKYVGRGNGVEMDGRCFGSNPTHGGEIADIGTASASFVQPNDRSSQLPA